MSIAAPNLDNLPSRQAEKRAAKKAEKENTFNPATAEPQPLDMSKWQGRKSPPGKPSVCHPRRVEVADGLCKWCFEKRMNRVKGTELTPAQALAKQKKEGVEKIGEETRAVMIENLGEYARLHLEATRVATLKGDTRPSEWALTNIRTGDAPVVTPPAKDGGGGGGIKVVIGLAIGGLPPGTVQAITVPVEAVPAEVLPDTT